MSKEPLIKLRPYQDAGFRHQAGWLAYLYRRQSGKSFGLALTAIDWMMEEVCDVIFASAAMRLGQEVIRKEAQVWATVTAKMREAADADGRYKLTSSADDDDGELLDIDAICDLFEHQKLETRIWHSDSKCSRSLVVAPNPDTAVGWTGNLILDEVGRIVDLKDVLEAVEPFLSSNPKYRCRLATTPPPDDAHHSYELLAPDPEAQFSVNPRGNYYRSQTGLLVHRVDAWDGEAAGIPLFDSESRTECSPEEHRASYIDKDAWDRNYGCQFLRGGTAALSLTAMNHSQAAGADHGTGYHITETLRAA